LLKSSKDHFTKNANNFKPFQEERDGLNRLLTVLKKLFLLDLKPEIIKIKLFFKTNNKFQYQTRN